MYQKIKNEVASFRLLLKSLPATVVTLFVMAVFSMNLLANKSIAMPYSWLALDCGILFSWITFLVMDIVTKHFGAKAATQLSIFAVLVNLAFCMMLFIASRIPGSWGEAYIPGSEQVLNRALNRTFGGTWYVLLGSTIAFIVSAFINNYLNAAVGRRLERKLTSFFEYAMRTYISTAVGQFADNLVFSMLVSRTFFGWTAAQCVVCAFTGMVVELLFEVIFSSIGYRVSAQWRKERVGEAYLNKINERGAARA